MFACSGMQILMKLKISYQGCDTYQYFSDTLDLINKETSLLHMYLYGIEKCRKQVTRILVYDRHLRAME